MLKCVKVADILLQNAKKLRHLVRNFLIITENGGE